jgi:hypothetical protein
MIALVGPECPDIESRRAGRDARQHHASIASGAARALDRLGKATQLSFEYASDDDDGKGL